MRAIIDFFIVRALVVMWSGAFWYVVAAFAVGLTIGFFL